MKKIILGAALAMAFTLGMGDVSAIGEDNATSIKVMSGWIDIRATASEIFGALRTGASAAKQAKNTVAQKQFEPIIAFYNTMQLAKNFGGLRNSLPKLATKAVTAINSMGMNQFFLQKGVADRIYDALKDLRVGTFQAALNAKEMQYVSSINQVNQALANVAASACGQPAVTVAAPVVSNIVPQNSSAGVLMTTTGAAAPAAAAPAAASARR